MDNSNTDEGTLSKSLAIIITLVSLTSRNIMGLQ